MPQPSPPTPPHSSLPAAQARQLLSALTSFLTVAIHSLLYHRALYPAASFLAARAHNLPVHQSRHPGVCAWVRDAVAAAEAQIRTGTARTVVLVIHGPPQQSLAVLERWVFDLQSFPAFTLESGALSAEQDEEEDAAAAAAGALTMEMAAMGEDTDMPPAELGARDDDHSENGDGDEQYSDDEAKNVNWTDVNEALRGALSKIAYAAEKSSALPKNCTFTLAVELRDQAPRPINHKQPWIPVEAKRRSQKGERRHGAGGSGTVIPIRSVRAGPLFMECWLESVPPIPQN